MRGTGIIGVLGMSLGLAVAEPVADDAILDLEAVQPQDEAMPAEWVEPLEGAPQRAKVTSASRQFRVYGGDAGQRGSIAIEADTVRRHYFLLQGLEAPEPAFPIEIHLHGRPGDAPQKRPVAYRLFYTNEGFMLRIHVDMARGVDHERLERAVLSGMLYQQALAEVAPGPREAPLRAPVWLIEGLREADAWRQAEGDRGLYEGVFNQGGWFTLDELFAMDDAGFAKLDGASRAAFRVLSGALAMALLEQPRGREAFASFCREVAAYEGDIPILLRQHFPELNLSERSLAKWWALTLAKLADAPLTEVLGILATEQALEDALVLHFRDPQGQGVSRAFANDPALDPIEPEARAAAVRPAQEALNRLSYRCFPSYRPLLLDYQRLLQQWASGAALEDIAPTLGELDETRLLMAQRAVRARDYLDFLEIDRSSELSGSFEDYMDLVRELEERPRAERSDPLSEYLDTFERVYDSRGDRK